MILIDENNVIIAKSDSFVQTENGVLLNEIFYGVHLKLRVVDIIAPENVVPKGYKYQNDEFVFIAGEKALERISGKCSANIYAGANIGDKHYSFTTLAQSTIAENMQSLRNGATSVPYSADGEDDYSPYTLAEMSVVDTTMKNCVIVNTHYKKMLKQWIARETEAENAEVLNAIDYGSRLPDDLMLKLGTQLAVYGIDINDYEDKFSLI